MWRWFPKRWLCLVTCWQLTPSLQVGPTWKMGVCDVQRINTLNYFETKFKTSSRPAWEDSAGVPGWRLRRPSHHAQRHSLPDTLSSRLSLWQHQPAPPSPQEEAPPPSSPPPSQLSTPPPGHRGSHGEHRCRHRHGGGASRGQRIRGMGRNGRPVDKETAALREGSS